MFPLRNQSPSFLARRALSFLVVVLMVGCQNADPAGSLEPLEGSALTLGARAQQLLLTASQAFDQAAVDNDPLGMMEAALQRDQVQRMLDVERRAEPTFVQKTEELIRQALAAAPADSDLSEQLRKRLDRRQRILDPGVLSSGGLFGNRIHTKERKRLIRELTVAERGAEVLAWSVTGPDAAIAYVEHQRGDRIVLRLLDDSGAPVCEQQNTRGHLLCRWQPERDGSSQTISLVIENRASQPANVLLIKNQ